MNPSIQDYTYAALQHALPPSIFASQLVWSFEDGFDNAWSDTVWRNQDNRFVHHIHFSGGCCDVSTERVSALSQCSDLGVISILPCMGYIMVGNELFTTIPSGCKLYLKTSTDHNATYYSSTVLQYLKPSSDIILKEGFNLNISKPWGIHGSNIYLFRVGLLSSSSHESGKMIPPRQALHPGIFLYPMRYVYEGWRMLSVVKRFLARRAILRKLKSCHFTKLSLFMKLIPDSKYVSLQKILYSGIVSEHISNLYLGVTRASEGNCNSVIKPRSEKFIQSKGRMQFSR